MKIIYRFLCCLALASAALVSCGPEFPEPNVTPSKPDDTEKPSESENQPSSIKSVAISLVTKGIHSISMQTVTTGSYALNCTGADPYVFSGSLTSNIPDDHQILEFEYKCDKSFGDLQIFYAINSAPSEASSKKYADLPATSSYKKYVVDISAFRSSGWGKKGDCLRFDPGNDGGYTFYIRNIVVRQMTEEEQSSHQDMLDKEAAKQKMADNLQEYLAKTYPSSVTKVTVTSDQVTVEGKVSGDGEFLLADVVPWQDITELATFPYTEPIKDKNFSITIPRMVEGREGIIYDRVFSKWAVVKVDGEKHVLDSHGHYADEVAPKSSPAPVALKNKKGFGAGDHDYYFKDIDEMNAGSITMNVVLNGYLTGKGGDYTYGGIGYGIGGIKSYVDMITSKCLPKGTVISAIILCSTGSHFNDPENEGGYYSMPNMTTAEAFNMYAAGLEHMASRYNKDDFGRISHWIMHNEVDMGYEWTNMGSQPMMRYLDRYVKSMRICYNIVRQYDQNAAVLGSYTHCWNSSDGGYAPKEMLEKTVQYSKAEGDFWWGVAYHPYPQDLTKPEFWNNDTRSTYSMDSPYVTFKNLEVIDKWIKSEENLYKGEKKRILFLSEQGTNSPSYSDSDLAKQAAGGAWAWKKVSRLDGIDAIQWHNWADNKAEFGLRIGLRAFEEGNFKALDPKPVWNVWKAGGSADEDAVFNPYLSTIGISSWDDIMHDM